MTSPSANPTPITPPRVALIDQRTGLIDRAWYMYFLSLFNAAQIAVDGQNLGPDAASLAASLEAALQQTTQELQTQPVSVVEQIQPLLDAIAQRLDTLPRPELGTMAALQQANVPWVTFDTTPQSVPPDVGTLAWDGGTTLGVQMTPNVLLKVGEAEFVYAKASAAITKGQVCYHTGAVGSSGVTTVAPAPIGLTDPNQIVGIAAESIALNDFGLIQVSGDIKGFDTTGSSVSEVWADGDPLYYNPAYVGSLTKNKPSAPNQKTYMGEVINAGSGGSGSMHIRIVQGSILGGTDSNVQFGALANGNLIQYDSALQYWKNVAPSSVAVTTFSAGTTGFTPSTPTSGAVTLAGTLSVANGGTGLTSGTSGGVLYYSAAGTLASSAALAANALVVGGGAGVAPSTITTGTGVTTALGVNTGTAGAFVVNGGALGTPSSGTVTNLTGTASISINGTVGATTPNTGAFTSITSTSAAGILTRAAATQDGVELIGRAGGTSSFKVTLTPTTLTASRTLTLPDNSGTILTTGATVTTAQGGTGLTSFTANGVLFASSTSVLATGSALTFDGTNLATTGTASATKFIPTGGTATGNGMYLPATNTLAWSNNGLETLRLDSSGNLGLGVTPSAWGSNYKAFESAANSAVVVAGANINGTIVSANAYQDNTNWLYKTTGAAAYYGVGAGIGVHAWFTAPSGTAGNTIAFTQAMTLDNSGRLLVGTTSAITGVNSQIEQIQLYGTGGAASSFATYSISNTLSANVRQYRARAGTTALAAGDAIGVNSFVGYNGTAWANVARVLGAVDTASGGNLGGRMTFDTATSGGTLTERMRIDSNGYVGIGTLTPAYPLDIPSTANPAARIGGILIGANGTDIKSDTGILALYSNGANEIQFHTNAVERLRVDSNGNVRVNTAAIATTATNGFLYVPTCAGTPTGTPTAITGLAPIVVDSTNNKLYFYSGGAWRDAGP